jgi:hypothetical protein
MDICFNCPRCGQHLAVEEGGAGMIVNCPSCKGEIEIPHSTSQPPVPPTPRRTGTLSEHLTELLQSYDQSEFGLRQPGMEKTVTAAELLHNLSPEELDRPIATETSGRGDFILDAQSEERMFQIVWSATREGWVVRQFDNSKPHYYVTEGNLLVSLCSRAIAPADSRLQHEIPAGSGCKKCCQHLDERKNMPVTQLHPRPPSIAAAIASAITFRFSHGSSREEFKRGLLVYEPEVVGAKLDRRNIAITSHGESKRLSIDALRAGYHAGNIPPEADVLVTDTRADGEVYCGEGTVASVVEAWEKAPLDFVDRQEVKRMVKEFALPEYQVESKAQFADLKRLYDRCDKYYIRVASDKNLKRLTKEATKSLVLSLDESDPMWDAGDGERRFVEELRRRQPELIRSEGEKQARRRRQQKQKLEREAKRPLIETRNNLTGFPHKEMQLEAKDIGTVRVRDIKANIRSGVMSPETLVRYRSTDEWVELCEFLNDWMKSKATLPQIEYLTALQRQHGITDDIPLDIPRRDISVRITALVSSKEA